MIPGPDANICVDCVRHANEMVTRHEKKAKDVPPLPPTPTPKEIKAFLDQYVIGHDEVNLKKKNSFIHLFLAVLCPSCSVGDLPCGLQASL